MGTKSGMPRTSVVARCVHKSHYRPRDAGGVAMKTMSAKEAKNAFGLMIDTARAEPVKIEKHGRAVVVVLSVEEYDRLSRDEPGDNEESEVGAVRLRSE